MGASKTNQYSNKQLQFAQIAKAIGHPARIAIVQHLVKVGCANNRMLAHLISLSEATTSQHLSELKKARLIEENFIGNKHIVFLKEGAEKKLNKLHKEIFI